MRRARLAVLGLALALAACRGDARPRTTAPIAIAPDAGVDAAAGGDWFPPLDAIAAQVTELASPTLRGRGGGTPDELAAAERVATWLRAAGAEPAGDDDGYLTRFAYPGGKSQNVVGVIRGRDPAAQHVVVGAHYDHLGVDDRGIYLGADDNASGTAGSSRSPPRSPAMASARCAPSSWSRSAPRSWASTARPRTSRTRRCRSTRPRR
jgi:hypothetical protein